MQFSNDEIEVLNMINWYQEQQLPFDDRTRVETLSGLIKRKLISDLGGNMYRITEDGYWAIRIQKGKK